MQHLALRLPTADPALRILRFDHRSSLGVSGGARRLDPRRQSRARSWFFTSRTQMSAKYIALITYIHVVILS
jgi:hypothetical protein